MSHLRRRRAISSHLAGLLAIATLIASGCSGGVDLADQDHAAATAAQLLADDIAPEVVDCVLRVGRTELQRSMLSDAAIDELLTNCRAAHAVLGRDKAPKDAKTDQVAVELAMTSAVWSYGDSPLLDQLWDACDSGTGSACDELFATSPVGSEYEEFGVTCGGRDDVLDCEELDVAPDETD